MMEQYLRIKSEYENYILFYRLGDFYEMFFKDAEVASKVLDLVLTGRDCGEGKKAPMCGIPYHAAEGYIGKLIKAGLKVAICEQVEDPKTAKGIVKRDVIRVVTQGTLVESDLLQESKNNYLCAICFSGKGAALAFADVSCASLSATVVESDDDITDKIINEISTFCPSEIIASESLDKYPRIKQFVLNRLGIGYSDETNGRFDYGPCSRITENQFGREEVAEYMQNGALISAIGGALSYLAEVHRRDIPNIRELRVYKENQYMEIDSNTRRSLELTEAMRTGEKKGSLLWVLDKTNTGPGARLLRRFIDQPLTDIAEITRRQNAVAELKDAFMKRSDIEDKLETVLDLERLLTKVICGSANARDLVGIASTLRVMPSVKAILEDSTSAELKRIYNNLDNLQSLEVYLSDALKEDAPFSVREGGMIRSGYNETLDRLREAVDDVNGWLERIANEEREKTGIRTLRIGYNRVFGYYIEVSKSFMDQVPDNYIRKQTLANGERYITEELKIKEAEMLGAKDKIQALEYEIFGELCKKVIENAPAIRRTASLISLLDVYTSLAAVASAGRYVCPEISADNVIDIKNGRHPVVEKFMQGEGFVPNDTYLDTETQRTMLITGPNMAGKSTYMRQTALITLMAQIGSFVPADSARIGAVDKIFTRVGASDDLAGGQSTFMLEMNEVAYILKNATKKSLIIYDEVGRGTSTYDGMSVARAVVEYTNSKKIGARTMFATHYHELTSLENEYEGIVNYNIAAKKKGENIIFLRKILRGSTDDSFGIEVARLAGVPAEVTSRAKEVLRSLEEGGEMKRAANQKKKQEPLEEAFSIETLVNAHIASVIAETDVDSLTPKEALTLIYSLKEELI